MTKQPHSDIQHLYTRATFGLHPKFFSNKINKNPTQLFEELLEESKEYSDLKHFEDIRIKGKDIGGFKILKMILKSRKELQELNLAWLDKMHVSRAQLREKMTLFWHHHFATSAPFPVLMQEQNNMFRKNAMGNFKDLLLEVARDPAMIIYLNNQQNKKNAPNENFARELMELFTLGRGHYSENDIKESARAFTGWHIGLDGYFAFDKKSHDDGEKTFFNQTGNWNGDDIIRMILEKRQTARFICQKLYKFFVSPKVNEAFVEKMTDEFFTSNYDITRLIRFLFTSEEFYLSHNRGALIKSPVELIVEYKRFFSLEMNKDQNMIKLQRALGQVLFLPPNVAGWPGDRSWIDSTSLLVRMNLPYVFAGIHEYDPQEKALPESALIEQKGPKPFLSKMNISSWNEIATSSKNPKAKTLFDYLIIHPHMVPPIAMNEKSSTDEILRAILSLPEFQLH